MIDLKSKRDKEDFFIALVVLALFGWFLYHFIFCNEEPLEIAQAGMVTQVENELSKDSDYDGIKDSEDACPTVAGPIEGNGCPIDADGDGVNDKEDYCPNLKGSADNHGCPLDSDKDGVYDAKDKCPDLAGTPENDGCPADTDGDGIYDSLDKCPNRPGNALNGGCPEIKIEKAEAAILEKALKAVEFETASAKLKSKSHRILNDIASIMGKYPAYKVNIYGHTDSDGDAAANQDLSRKRAEACKKYLESRGVASLRMDARGFGETKPVADNNTPEGKSSNRRVEFNLHY